MGAMEEMDLERVNVPQRRRRTLLTGNCRYECHVCRHAAARGGTWCVCELYRSAACGQEVLKCTLRKTCIPTFVKVGMSVILTGKVKSSRRN